MSSLHLFFLTYIDNYIGKDEGQVHKKEVLAHCLRLFVHFTQLDSIVVFADKRPSIIGRCIHRGKSEG
jgi:hypothetical protein